ncbi:MAG TPA: molybdate ABC transporter substrate-binding protein [Candidatus Acidoferrum sp.]|jgi:molybdate transport system substrate-binding protein|nr:molybdate ABC transporter substrate-binding protein [Candidatus Acidoferrum sp.]
MAKIRPTILIFFALAIFSGASRSTASTAELKIAAAADLTFAFKDVAARFEKQTGSELKLTYGSSGNFFQQIQNGAPFDLFFSADVNYPKKLEAAGLIEPGTIYEYASGKLVIWAPNSSKLDLSRGLATLLDPGIRKIAIANPQHAPYGAAAVAAMRHENIYDKVKDKLVLGENISQTAQFVQSGNADVGILALSLALAPAMKDAGRYVEVSSSDYPPIIQAAVIPKSSQNKDLARQFLKFLKEPETVALMRQYGFTVPNDVAAETSAPQ